MKFVAHWGAQHLSVGRLLARNPHPIDAAAARAWAVNVLGDEVAERLIEWSPISADAESDSQFTMDGATVAMYFLRRYPDCWRLTQSLQRTDGSTGIESEAEMRAYAIRVVEQKIGTRVTDWTTGPSPDGVTTLYATA